MSNAYAFPNALAKMNSEPKYPFDLKSLKH